MPVPRGTIGGAGTATTRRTTRPVSRTETARPPTSGRAALPAALGTDRAGSARTDLAGSDRAGLASTDRAAAG
ncbi:hypothetical protein Ate02nite_86800 [Paractinoplanes tereljensis]|uniref:Uncharacterized protein n=1 Tax=Paractinoplanes tereljensis TaxID=571912 RepID=A0A919NXB3_9ACTN|nr:hypothetical protein Ate02nite_86800 [Actinoplanes tereljensis]